MTVRVLVVDDHELIRAGVRRMLEAAGAKVVAEGASADDAVRLARETTADVMLLDVRLGDDDDGVAALARIRVGTPSLPVVMFSAYDNPAFVARCVALGAAGYVAKHELGANLVKTLHTAATGSPTFSREEMRRVTGALSTPRHAGDIEIPLTHRECEVLRFLAAGRTNREIAAKLGISYETVKEHVQHILKKIGVVDRTQAAVWAMRKGLAASA